MAYFWYTSDTIPKGLGFSHFDSLHLTWLTIAVTAIILCCGLYHRLSDRGRAVFRKTAAVLLIADELFKLIPMLAMGVFHVKYLPFQLCSINIFIIACHAWKPNRLMDNFLYIVCIPGALAALLFPTWTKLPALNFMCIHSFTVHILLVLYPVVLTANREIKPEMKYLPGALALLAAFAALALALNLAWDVNFMFLMKASKGNPLYWFAKNWGSHLWGFPVIISAIILVMYVPVELWRRRKLHKKSRRSPDLRDFSVTNCFFDCYIGEDTKKGGAENASGAVLPG